jgi:hypothetical protein
MLRIGSFFLQQLCSNLPDKQRTGNYVEYGNFGNLGNGALPQRPLNDGLRFSMNAVRPST